VEKQELILNPINSKDEHKSEINLKSKDLVNTGADVASDIMRYEDIAIEDLIKCKNPENFVSHDIWKGWCKIVNCLPSLKELKINDIARKNRLAWPFSRRHDLVSKYSCLSTEKIIGSFSIRESRNVRTIIICIASIAKYYRSEKEEIGDKKKNVIEIDLKEDYENTPYEKKDICILDHKNYEGELVIIFDDDDSIILS
jgi:hypothetical protein